MKLSILATSDPISRPCPAASPPRAALDGATLLRLSSFKFFVFHLGLARGSSPVLARDFLFPPIPKVPFYGTHDLS